MRRCGLLGTESWLRLLASLCLCLGVEVWVARYKIMSVQHKCFVGAGSLCGTVGR